MSDAQNTAGRFAELRSQPIVACCCRWLNHSSDLLTRVLFVTIINSLERSRGGWGRDDDDRGQGGGVGGGGGGRDGDVVGEENC